MNKAQSVRKKPLTLGVPTNRDSNDREIVNYERADAAPDQILFSIHELGFQNEIGIPSRLLTAGDESVEDSNEFRESFQLSMSMA